MILIQIESGGVDHAVGDNGKALGCLQIHAICVEDVNRIYRTNYKHYDALDREKAIEICKLYLMHYGDGLTVKQVVKIWNGGPEGHKKEATKKYWEKFKKAREEWRKTASQQKS